MRTGSRLQVTELYFGAFGTNCKQEKQRQLKKKIPQHNHHLKEQQPNLSNDKETEEKCQLHNCSFSESNKLCNRITFSGQVDLPYNKQKVGTGGKYNST